MNKNALTTNENHGPLASCNIWDESDTWNNPGNSCLQYHIWYKKIIVHFTSVDTWELPLNSKVMHAMIPLVHVYTAYIREDENGADSRPKNM